MHPSNSSACTYAGQVSSKPFTIADLHEAMRKVDAMMKPEEDAFNDLFVKPHGFDMHDETTRIITGNEALAHCVPPRWRDRIMYVHSLAPDAVFLWKGSEDLVWGIPPMSIGYISPY